MSTLPINSMKPTTQVRSNEGVDQKLREVSELYEKQFLREMVKAMRQTVQHGGMTEPSTAENIFREKLDHEYVESWGQRGGVGLADVIFGQLKEKFNPTGPRLLPPQGPMPLDRSLKFKIDETKPLGIPVLPSAESTKGTDMSYLIDYEGSRSVQAPWDGKVLQSFSGLDGRQTLKLGHDNGLVSTLHFLGTSKNLHTGDRVAAGDKLGLTSPDGSQLTWQIVQVENSKVQV